MLKLAIVRGIKNDLGEFVAPDVNTLNHDSVLFEGDEKHVQITGLESGDSVQDGEYFVGKFNDVTNRFASNLVKVGAFNVAGLSNLGGVNVTPDEDGANVNVE